MNEESGCEGDWCAWNVDNKNKRKNDNVFLL